jgi:hypothetical protein
LANNDSNHQDDRGVERGSPCDPSTFGAMHGSSQAREQGEIADRIDRRPNRHEIANYFLEHRMNGSTSRALFSLLCASTRFS